MELREISLAQLLTNTSGSEYFSIFAKLIGYSEDAIFFEGIKDDEYYLLEELEEELGVLLPSNYLEFLSYLNGGHFLNVDLFSLADKEYPNSLYNINCESKARRELNLENNILIVGKFDNYIMYIDCDESDGTFTLMDIRNKEKIEFESFGSLIGFIFYVLFIKGNKKLEEEKARIKEMKERLHEEFEIKKKMEKKEKIKKNAKILEKISKKALKERMKKIRSK